MNWCRTHTQENTAFDKKCLLSECQCQCLATVSQKNLTLSHSLQSKTTNGFILSARLKYVADKNQHDFHSDWFSWQELDRWQRVTKQFLCLSVQLYFCLNVSTSNWSRSPTAAFKLLKSMPHRYQNIIWGQFSLTKKLKSVNLYYKQWWDRHPGQTVPVQHRCVVVV